LLYVENMVRTVAAIVLGIVVALHASTTALAFAGGFAAGYTTTVDVGDISITASDRGESAEAQDNADSDDQNLRDGSPCQDHCGWHILATTGSKFPAAGRIGKHAAARLASASSLVAVPPPQ